MRHFKLPCTNDELRVVLVHLAEKMRRHSRGRHCTPTKTLRGVTVQLDSCCATQHFAHLRPLLSSPFFCTQSCIRLSSNPGADRWHPCLQTGTDAVRRGAMTMVPHPCTRHKVPASTPPGGDYSPQAKQLRRHTATTAGLPGTGTLHPKQSTATQDGNGDR